MNRDPNQLSLFPKRALFKDAPGQPFSLQASPEEIVICVVCGRERLIRRREGGRVVTTRVGEHSDCQEER